VKFRLEPTPEQEQILREHCGQARLIWNLGLNQRNCYHPYIGPTPDFVEMSAQLTQLRKEVEWLQAGSQTVQQQALKDLDQAFRNWWSNPGHFGRPTWRSRGRHEGFRIVGTQASRFERLSRKRARILIPKVGWVNWRWTRNPGEVKSYRIKRDAAGRWWIAFAMKPEPKKNPGNNKTLGIDCGVAHSFVTSEGDMIDIPGLSPGEAKRLLTLQRKLARQELGSNQREKTKREIAKLVARRVNRKKDVIEKLTTQLATSYEWIHIEDLKLRNMTRSAKGTIEEPSKNVAQKRGLNRSILEQGWGLFAQRLEDKAPGRVKRINPAYSSQCCSACRHIAKENRESQAVFLCKACGYQENADVNAAKVLAAGHAVSARGESVVLGSVEPALVGFVKREPQLTC